MSMVRVLAFGLVIAVVSGCRKQPAAVEGCLDVPPPPEPGERGPFPFEACAPRLREPTRIRELDQEATVLRRKVAAQACCYAPVGKQ